MHEDQKHGWNNPTVRKDGLSDDREYGHSDPNARKGVVLAATHMYCSICDAEPCYMLTTAAMSVVHEQLTENDCDGTTNLISAVQYAQSLERLHGCIARHIEVTREAWQLNEHFRVSDEATREVERQRNETEQLQNLQPDNKDPPSLN
jgi:hypothetical protein